ncbi:phosphatidylinositol kinase [Vibrio alginolyticus]|uniref:phosphatidylinositol kinase n=1 Tax=Vibrio alginolyticus TaxID=663 RepID=UPI00215C2986|nr:phosphatidylinositol kinase [Vibrio alginolyticus]MCR9961504.1 phosphatidylinositol kinase [Vibrio alginolyticus]
MSEFAVLMPFAKSDKTGKIIGIQEAERGDKCDCRCLSCATPVTARQADVNQWHFAHRVNETTTASECEFSPVTAIALVIRQQLPHLQTFDLDEWSFNDVCWQFDVPRDGIVFDAYTQDPNSKRKVVFDIPFANDKGLDSELVPDDIDIVLSVDTHAIARALYSSDRKPELLSAEEIFLKLLERWEDWVTMLRWPVVQHDFKEKAVARVQPPEIEKINDPSNHRGSGKCACCGIREGHYGKGLLCAQCVRANVGPKFPNLTEMIRHYR